MANYNINKSDGTPVVVPTGAIDNSFDIPLLGQDSINYGDDLATAQLRLLENFANSTPPSFGTDRTTGQLWYDTTASEGLKVWNGSTFNLLPLDVDVVHLTGAETIAGIKTFTSSAAFTAAAVPFTVNSTTKVANLNASQLDGNLPTAFAKAFQGVLAENAEPDLPTVPTDGFILSSTIAGVRSWISPTVGTGNVDPADAAADTTTSVLLAGTPTGDQQPLTDAGITYNAGTNALTTTTFIGALTGNADTATSATTATTATTATQITLTDTELTSTFVVLSPAATGNQGALTDEELIFNASTGALTATSFVGVGTALTALTAANITLGVLAVARGGTGVSTSTGSGTATVLHTSPTFVTRITTPAIRNGATGTTLEFNSIAAFRIVDQTSADQSTAAEVLDAAGTFRPVGIAPSPQIDITAATELLTQARSSATLRCNSASAIAVTTEAATGTAQTDIPNGTMWIVKAFGAGAVTIVAGTSVTLTFWNGSGGVPSTGTRTLARAGVATVQKIDDNEYDVWGVGLT